ncbi:GATOR complex protein [Trichinella spiralis]|uniref:GATOR complex protein n=1 Tax=Trichinella spiralis TaxID=6334 RepID=A0ABR3KM63_TRISP
MERQCHHKHSHQSYNIVMKGVDLHDRLAAAYHLMYLNYVLFLKIVDVSDEKNFRELHSLKVGDQPRSLASSLDVSWNKVKVNRIATATGTGHIALWNLSRSEVNRVE